MFFGFLAREREDAGGRLDDNKLMCWRAGIIEEDKKTKNDRALICIKVSV